MAATNSAANSTINSATKKALLYGYQCVVMATVSSFFEKWCEGFFIRTVASCTNMYNNLFVWE